MSNVATKSGSGNVYHDVRITGDGRAHLGNNYNYGPSEDEKILESVIASLYYPEMGASARFGRWSLSAATDLQRYAN